MACILNDPEWFYCLTDPASLLDNMYIQFFGDDFLRLLMLRFVFCYIVLILHRGFKVLLFKNISKWNTQIVKQKYTRWHCLYKCFCLVNYSFITKKINCIMTLVCYFYIYKHNFLIWLPPGTEFLPHQFTAASHGWDFGTPSPL